VTAVEIGIAVALGIVNVVWAVVIIRDRRWLRRVERASGDPERLGQLLYGPRRPRMFR
jgi:hypothetical protein